MTIYKWETLTGVSLAQCRSRTLRKADVLGLAGVADFVKGSD